MGLNKPNQLSITRRLRHQSQSQRFPLVNKWTIDFSSERTLADQASPDNLPASKRLPQSPLITHPQPGPVKIRKNRPTRNDTSELEKNPWAVALASPVRMCSVTGARIPRDLLGEWGLVRKPDTENHYLLPVGLMKDALKPRSKAEANGPEEVRADLPSTDEATQESTIVNAVRQEKPGQQLLLRMINSQPLLQALSKPLSRNSGKRPAIAKILPFRWKHPLGPITSRVEKQLLWRPDMADYVLRQRQQAVINSLDKVQRRHPRLDLPEGAWKVLDVHEPSVTAISEALGRLGPLERMASGVILLLSPLGGSAPTAETLYSPTTESEVPLFDLPALLTPSDLAKLRATEPGYFHGDAVFFRPDNRVDVEAVLALWNLQRYAAGVNS
ncbi:hypothetical protein N7539_007834 [Penicillium diatomitis]|uniref:Uncharacterized protein n=1 Tax=Penicillium diatomitis TaxID=2819901 RepID=A0A9W9WU29_9EURO|nr:uncharacterized protein N7539_007834 [Penicillium diatomitis]KAJ5475547.1 hypothetical protein N7539_007834 [Penicillium diatomitis]